MSGVPNSATAATAAVAGSASDEGKPLYATFTPAELRKASRHSISDIPRERNSRKGITYRGTVNNKSETKQRSVGKLSNSSNDESATVSEVEASKKKAIGTVASAAAAAMLGESNLLPSLTVTNYGSNSSTPVSSTVNILLGGDGSDKIVSKVSGGGGGPRRRVNNRGQKTKRKRPLGIKSAST